jgi:hypothetical protein
VGTLGLPPEVVSRSPEEINSDEIFRRLYHVLPHLIRMRLLIEKCESLFPAHGAPPFAASLNRLLRTTPPPGPGRAMLNGRSHISTRLISGGAKPFTTLVSL